jgi:hypothetical protein
MTPLKTDDKWPKAIMTLDDVWRAKCDEDLVTAARQLTEYSQAAQSVITAEIQRRGLYRDNLPSEDEPDPVERGEDSGDSVVCSRSRVFLGRLWFGEMSLPVTFWFWGVLGSRIVLGVSLTLAKPSGSALIALIGLAVYLAYMVFIAVAIWRSSRRYNGPRFWADLSRVWLAIGIIFFLGEIFVSR